MMRKEISIAIATLLCASLLGCGSGDSGSSNSGSTSRQILAKNVLLTPAHASLADKGQPKKEVDTTTTVTADNVAIDTSGNSLSSTNLQDALDKEMAIKLSNILPGTWAITNKTTDPVHKDSGAVTFSSNALTVDQGSFAAAGLLQDYTEIPLTCAPISPISYEVITNSIMYLTWTDACAGGTIIHEKDSTVTIIARNTNSISMIGHAGYGAFGQEKISILTRVQ